MARLTGMKEICNYMNRSEATILGFIRGMDFPAAKVGGIWEADSTDIDKWREAHAKRLPQKIDPTAKKRKIETLI